MLTHEAIVESERTFTIEKVPLPAWAGICNCTLEESFLYARTIGAEREEDVERLTTKQQEREKNKEHGRKSLAFAEWAVLGACDEQGEPFFTEADIPALVKRPMMALVDLANATMKLNGVIKDEPATKEAAPEGAPKED